MSFYSGTSIIALRVEDTSVRWMPAFSPEWHSTYLLQSTSELRTPSIPYYCRWPLCPKLCIIYILLVYSLMWAATSMLIIMLCACWNMNYITPNLTTPTQVLLLFLYIPAVDLWLFHFHVHWLSVLRASKPTHTALQHTKNSLVLVHILCCFSMASWSTFSFNWTDS